MHSGGAKRYATAESWNSFNESGRRVEWSGREIGPLASIVVGAAKRVAARTNVPLESLHLLETGANFLVSATFCFLNHIYQAVVPVDSRRMLQHPYPRAG